MLLIYVEVPRNYVSDLEAQVGRLTEKLYELQEQIEPALVNGETPTSHRQSSSNTHEPGTSPPFAQPATSDGSPSQLQDLVKSVRNVVAEPSRQPRFLGQSSGITLAKMVMAAVRVDALTSPLFSEQRPYDPPSSALAVKATLPPRHAADHLVRVYFQYRNPHLPIVKRSQVEVAVANTYQRVGNAQDLDHAAEKDAFMAYMVFAIALFDVPSPSGGRPSQSEGCFRSAVGWVEHVITYSRSDIDTLRAVLLLAQFVALCPSRGSFWHLTGFALRLCIDIGLHWETEEQALQMDPDTLHERRSLWYSTYQFDRVLCITLGRPFGIVDESTRVPLPDPWATSYEHREFDPFDVHSQEAHNHLFSLSKLESEIKHVLHSQTWELKLSYPRVDYSAWLQDIQPRLQHWYDTIPQPHKAHPLSIFAYQAYWNVMHSNAILLLHRPHSIALHPSTESLFVIFDASCKLIASTKVLQREGKIDIQWKSVHELFMAGLGIIYGLWQAKEIRSQRSASSSIATLHSCASTLSAFSESFAGAAGCRDAFETLSTATVDWLLTQDAEQERQNRLALEKQVEGLLQQLRPSREGIPTVEENNDTNYMLNMLSADNFAFSEMLSSTAQWPEFQSMEYDDMSQYSSKAAEYNAGWWQ